ncbi:hypothetical protein Ciccas_006571 [Cichlidogyrus casuarinus]|uniref:Uncharacterized protein n=1 Tax=Cichlidogyrus casuarinus TaxID=1844966 RepID=A0ABD2Q7S4_9PLAT
MLRVSCAEPVTQNLKLMKSGLSFKLVDHIRSSTDARHSRCLSAVKSILYQLSEDVPQITPHLTPLLEELTSPQAEKASYPQSPDWNALLNFFQQLQGKTSDQQESGWQLHDSKHEWTKQLQGYTNLLCKVNPRLLLVCLDSVEMRPCFDLISLYQLETDANVRIELLLALGACFSAAPKALEACFDSILPTELIRQLLSPNEFDNTVLYLMSIRALTMFFARSTQLSYLIRDQLNIKFFDTLLLYMDSLTDESNASRVHRSLSKNSLKSYLDEKNACVIQKAGADALRSDRLVLLNLVQEHMLGLFVSINRFFHKENLLIDCLQRNCSSAKPLIEKLIQYFNLNCE